VERGGEPHGGGESVRPAIRADEVQAAVALEAVRDLRAPAKIGPVRAAAHGHVLAKVHELARLRIEERAGAPAQAAPGLEQLDLEAALGRGRSRGQARQPAADHGHARAAVFVRAVGHGKADLRAGRKVQRAARHSFCQALKRARRTRTRRGWRAIAPSRRQ